MASQPAERTVQVIEQDSTSDSTDDDSQSTESDGDEVVVSTQYPCPVLVQQYPYHQPVLSYRSPTKHGRHHGKKRGKENHGERRHNKEHRHGHGHGHSGAQGDDSIEGHRHDGEGQHRQSEGHHHGSKGHHHDSKGHHHERGHHRHGDGHRSRQGTPGGRHRRRHGSLSSEEGSDLVFKCVDVQDFKQEEVKVTVSGDTVKVKAVSDSGEISRVFKVTKDHDISKMRVSRSRSGILTVAVPAKDSSEDVKQDTSTK